MPDDLDNLRSLIFQLIIEIRDLKRELDVIKWELNKLKYL